MKDGDPVRILSIFERAIVGNCLQQDLWIRYVNYVVCIYGCHEHLEFLL